MIIDDDAACANETDEQISQQANGTEEERQDQGGYDQHDRYVVSPGVPDLPAADEQIECEIVNPSGQERALVLE